MCAVLRIPAIVHTSMHANGQFLGRRQVVRQRPLEPPFVGSNPTAPANQRLSDDRLLHQIQLFLDGAPPGLESHLIASAIESTVKPNGDRLTASVRFVPRAEMAFLHRFKGGEGPTNVLTFVEGANVDIAICPQVAEEDSKVRGWDLHSELVYLCIHGCLHALGFDHAADACGKQEMKRLERQMLADMGLETSALEP